VNTVAPSARPFGLALAVALLVTGRPARATLGESEASVSRDREALAMSRQPATARSGLGVHELRSPTVTVREYLSPAGTVFAVTWSGLTRPDLGPLLGAYHEAYRAAARRGPAGRGPRRVEAGRVVVETWGHARSLHGRAYLPALLPAGVSLDDLQ
jgi:hypothetical protein